MFQFSSIAGHQQIKIAEQIRYFDQLQFAISSKRGGEVLKLMKHKPVLEIYNLSIDDKDAIFCYDSESNFGGHFRKNWSVLSQLPALPRFKIFKLTLSHDAMDTLEELHEKAVFVPSGVILKWYSTEIDGDVFLKLTEMFHLKGFCSYRSNRLLNLFSLSAFREIPNIRLDVQNLPDDLLLLHQATKISLIQITVDRLFILANLFFQQWFEKKRNLQWLQLMCLRYIKHIKEDVLFSGLPFTVVWIYRQDDEAERRQKKIKFIKAFRTADFTQQEYCWPLNHSVYSIDRGDKKLFVFYCSRRGFLVAQEYTNLDDIIAI